MRQVGQAMTSWLSCWPQKTSDVLQGQQPDGKMRSSSYVPFNIQWYTAEARMFVILRPQLAPQPFWEVHFVTLESIGIHVDIHSDLWESMGIRETLWLMVCSCQSTCSLARLFSPFGSSSASFPLAFPLASKTSLFQTASQKAGIERDLHCQHPELPATPFFFLCFFFASEVDPKKPLHFGHSCFNQCLGCGFLFSWPVSSRYPYLHQETTSPDPTTTACILYCSLPLWGSILQWCKKADANGICKYVCVFNKARKGWSTLGSALFAGRRQWIWCFLVVLPLLTTDWVTDWLQLHLRLRPSRALFVVTFSKRHHWLRCLPCFWVLSLPKTYQLWPRSQAYQQQHP